MAVISNTIQNPGQIKRFDVPVTVELLWDVSTGLLATVPDSDTTISHTHVVSTDDQGYWSLDVIPNSDIDPTGSVYKITEGETEYYIQLDADADTWVGDVLVAKPEWVTT